MVVAFPLQLRWNGIFACPANGYSSDSYLGYCQATAYGDYDKGAFWFGLEPGLREVVAAADVLFLGSSRMQLGFSAPALRDWFLLIVYITIYLDSHTRRMLGLSGHSSTILIQKLGCT